MRVGVGRVSARPNCEAAAMRPREGGREEGRTMASSNEGDDLCMRRSIGAMESEEERGLVRAPLDVLDSSALGMLAMITIMP